MSGRYTFFTDASNTTRYRFSTALDFFNAIVDAINRGDCGINPNINDNSTTSSYINRANWGDGQVMFDRGTNDAVNHSLEICVDGLISKTGNSYLNDQVTEASGRGWMFGTIVGVFSVTILFTTLMVIARSIQERNKHLPSSHNQDDVEKGKSCCK